MPRVKNNLALRRYGVEDLKRHVMLTEAEKNLFQTFHNHRKYGAELKECLENYIANRVSMVHQLMNEYPLEQHFRDNRFSTLNAKGVAYTLGDLCTGRRKRKSTSVFLWARLRVSTNDGGHADERWFPLLPKGVKMNKLLKTLKRCGREPGNERTCNFSDSKRAGIGIPNSRSNAHSKLWMKQAERRSAADARQCVKLKNDNVKQLLGSLVNIGHVGFVKVHADDDEEDDTVWTKQADIDIDDLIWDDVTVCVNGVTNAGVVLRKFYQCMHDCGGPNAMISRQMTSNYVPRTEGVCNVRIENQPLDVLSSQLKNVKISTPRVHRTLRRNEPRVVNNLVRDSTLAFAAGGTANRKFLQVLELHKHMKDVIANLRDKLHRAKNDDYKHTIQRALRGAYFAMFLLLSVQKLSRRNTPDYERKIVSLGRMYNALRTLLADEFQTFRIGDLLTLKQKEKDNLKVFQTHNRNVCNKTECINRLQDGGVLEKLLDNYVAASATARLIVEKESLRLKLQRAQTTLDNQRDKHKNNGSWHDDRTLGANGDFYRLNARDWSIVPRDLVLAYKIWTHSQSAWKHICAPTFNSLKEVNEDTWEPWVQLMKHNQTVRQWNTSGGSRAAQSVDFEDMFKGVAVSLNKVREYMKKFNRWSRKARHNLDGEVKVSDFSRNPRVKLPNNVKRYSVLEEMRPGKVRSSLRRLQTICEAPPNADDERKERNDESKERNDDDGGNDNDDDNDDDGGNDNDNDDDNDDDASDGDGDDGDDDDDDDDDNYEHDGFDYSDDGEHKGHGPINNNHDAGGRDHPLTHEQNARRAARNAARAILPTNPIAPSRIQPRHRLNPRPATLSVSPTNSTIIVTDDDLRDLDAINAGSNPLDQYNSMYSFVDGSSNSSDDEASV